jgi:hypothetical protein
MESRVCRLLPGKNDEFEVKNGKVRFAMSLRDKACSCKWWDISGMPCKHAAICIGYKRVNIEDYVHKYYTVDILELNVLLHNTHKSKLTLDFAT